MHFLKAQKQCTTIQFPPLPRKGLLRKPPLVLVQGLAGQAETWYRNRPYWEKRFDVRAPELLTYQGDTLHERISKGKPITVGYLVKQLEIFLNRFVQTGIIRGIIISAALNPP